jgi:2'-5' RNA ligase
MIAGFPDDESLRRITKLKRDLDLDDASEVFGRGYYHVTLRYWKSEDEELAEKVKDWLEKNMSSDPIECEASGLSILGFKDSLVVNLASDKLRRLQKKIDDAIQEIGVPPSDHPSFKAHLTLAQGLKEAPELPKGFKIRLDKWKFTNKDEEVLWQA